jgi:HEAT repeat protein
MEESVSGAENEVVRLDERRHSCIADRLRGPDMGDEIDRIREIISNPTEDGLAELKRLLRDKTTPGLVQVEAANAILQIGFGPPSPEANEELAVWAEAAGIDMEKLSKEAADVLAKLRSKH